MSARRRTVVTFALAGVIVPGITWLLLTWAQWVGTRPIETACFILFVASYPFWVMLWGVMADPSNNLLFIALLCGSLVLNSLLYALAGVLFLAIRRRFRERQEIESPGGAI